MTAPAPTAAVLAHQIAQLHTAVDALRSRITDEWILNSIRDDQYQSLNAYLGSASYALAMATTVLPVPTLTAAEQAAEAEVRA